jgi:hypothetical protein
MKATKAFLAAGLAVMLGAGTAHAAVNSNTEKIGIGYQGIVWGDEYSGSARNGVSARYWINDNVGVGAVVAYGRDGYKYPGYEEHYSDIIGSVKVMYAPIVKANSRFYVGLSGGLGQASYEDSEGDSWDDDYWQIEPFMGFEYNIPGLQEISFNAEVGYAFNSWDDGYYEYPDSGVVVSVGAHYNL